MKCFNEYKLQIPLFYELCEKINVKIPSEIQRKCIEHLLDEKNKNVSKNVNIIKSEAGTGKTLVYFLYLLSCIDINNNKSIEVIYITPTRELALQTEEYLKLLNKENINYKVYIGGKANLPGKINKEKLNFKEIPKIIVGTLGKLNNILIKKGKLIGNNIFNSLKLLIVDEADKMLDQNKNKQFETFIKLIIEKLNLNPNPTKIILGSATFSQKELNFYTKIFQNYTKVENYTWLISKKENENISKIENFSISKNIIELIKIIPEKKHISYYEQKYTILYNLLSNLQSYYKQCLIFYNEKGKGEEISSDLRNYGLSVSFIHGDLNQDQRQLIYEKVKNLEVKIIISTDLFSRGIDLTAVNFVINIDFPKNNFDYYHRIGRTGRFFTNGIALTFVQFNEKDKIKELNGNLKEVLSDNDIDIIKEFENYFIQLGDNVRLSENEKKKIETLENKNFIKEEFLSQKRRRKQFENESNFSEWEEIKIAKKKEDKSNNIIDKSVYQNNINNDNKYDDIKDDENKHNENNHFCLYCDFFKLFDYE